MELYTSRLNAIKFKAPAAGIVAARWSYNEQDWTDLYSQTTDNKQTVSFDLPYTPYESDIYVEFSFPVNGQTFKETRVYHLVTPLLNEEELADLLPGLDEKDRRSTERVVRHIINAYTGQSFGQCYKALEVSGRGDNSIKLPMRLLEIERVSTLRSYLDVRGFLITNDGWYLKKRYAPVIARKEASEAYFEPGDQVVIAPPRTAGSIWKKDYPFTIEGRWGWKYVPTPVKEAAKLLATDFACNDQAYRDKYITDITSADWRLDFDSMVWVHTGNNRADHLLARYKVEDWLLI